MSLYALDRDAGTAIYRQIAQTLEAEIRGRYQPGDCIPAETLLAERFGVNRHTIRSAVDVLVAQGLLERVHGCGTFVQGLIDYAISGKTRFTEQIATLGMEAETEMLRRQLVPASSGVARRLALEDSAEVLFIETLRRVSGQPFCVVSHFFPPAMIGAALDDYHGGSLHGVLHARLDVRLRRVESLVSSTLPQGDDARLLLMPRTVPVLRVKSLNIDERSNQPIEYALTRFRADRVQLSVAV